MNTSEVLLVEHDPSGILQLTLNRPAELNAWTYDLEAAFFAALDSAAADPTVRTVVITGAGRGFCAGASMSLLGSVPDARPDRSVRRRLCELAAYPKPLIAAINGAAAGIGRRKAGVLACRSATVWPHGHAGVPASKPFGR